ncbi:MAG: hypothetical protein DRI90_19175 [Deltaproteobacteria bacterium]|nr:MAG: hypothetical protein DRI90_19175 [Deltaproteobacteria bacterium]
MVSVQPSACTCERVPGALFRGMARLLVDRTPGLSRRALARQLGELLQAQGISYHLRTVRRQLAGSVSSVPLVVEQCMRSLLHEHDDLVTDGAIDQALGEVGMAVPPEERESHLVWVESIVPLARLWLHFNPTRSKRSLAWSISAELEAQGLHVEPNRLQINLAGKGRLVHRRVRDQLLARLAPHGVSSYDSALQVAAALADRIEGSMAGRELVSATTFRDLARVWQRCTRSASRRPLAIQLRDELAAGGLKANHQHLQALLHVKRRRGTRRALSALEDLVRAVLPPGRSLEQALGEIAARRAGSDDLLWVRSEPIAQLAAQWLADHPSVSKRQLAIRVASTVRRLGFTANHNRIQLILGGRSTRARGYVYRALLKQCEGMDRDRIPSEHIVPNQDLSARQAAPPPPAPKPPPRAPQAGEPRDALSRYLMQLGRQPLLTAVAEVEIAKRMEQGENEALAALVACTFTRRAIIAIGDQVRQGNVNVQTVVRDCRDRDGGAGACRTKLLGQTDELASLDGQHEALRQQLAACHGSEQTQQRLRMALSRSEAAMCRAVTTLRLAHSEVGFIAGQLAAEVRRRDGFAHDDDALSLLPSTQETVAELRVAHDGYQLGERKAQRAREHLVAANLRLVVWVARKYQGRGVSLADLVQDGNMGLMRATEKFDFRRGHRFSTYASWWIMHGITRAVAESGRTIRVPSSAIQQISEIRRIARTLQLDIHREPTTEEIAFQAKLPVDRVHGLLLAARTAISIESPVGDNEAVRLGDLIADRDALSPFDGVSHRCLAERIGDLLRTLTPVEEKVLRMRYGIGEKQEHTLEEVGQQLAFSRERVRQIQVAALRKLHDQPRSQPLRSFVED